MSVIVRGVGHGFEADRWLFRGVTHEFRAGSLSALTGPSGSGKSTLLSILAGLETPTEGRVDSDGAAVISWVFQNPFGTPRRSARDHVMLPLLGRGASIDEATERAAVLLERVDLADSAQKLFRELSGGQAQRLMLARGLAIEPDLLLVDEPTAQLDRTTAAQVNGVIRALAGTGTTIVIATHDEQTRDVCDEYLDLADFADGCVE